MSGEALSIDRRQFGALVLTCALALVPTHLIMSGAVVLGFASLSAGGVAETGAPRAKPPQKQGAGPEAPPEATALRVRPPETAAFGRVSAFDPHAFRTLLPMAFAFFCALVILLAGLSLAHAAAVPVVIGAAGPARAWAAVAARLAPLLLTTLQSVPLIALGTLLFALPGVVLAVGFAFAMPVVMTEGLSGRAALERSWVLSRGRRAQIFALLLLLVFCMALGTWASLLVPVGHFRALVSGVVRLLMVPLPLLGLVLLHQRAVSTSAGSPPPDSSARGSPGSLRP